MPNRPLLFGTCLLFGACVGETGTVDCPPETTLALCSSDECAVGAADDGKADCNDENPSTADRCVPIGTGGGFKPSCGSVCAHVKVECDGLDDAAVQALRCDDGDACTVDKCAVSACVHQEIDACL